jgi:DNA repair exonuclease SbcCD ATPase subunit
MLKNTLIIALILLAIYLYYQNQKLKGLSSSPTMSSMFDCSDSDDEVPFPSRQKLQFELGQAREQISGLQEEISRLKGGSPDEFRKFIETLETEKQELKDQVLSLEQEIEKLKESKGDDEEVAELETERDEAIREKQTAEQEVLDLSNKLKLKNQEVGRKEEEIARVKKEKTDKEIALNKTITELKKSTQKEYAELSKKYSERTKQLDEEQTDNNKLTEKITELEQQIQELTNRSLSPIPGSFPEQEKSELEKTHQDQLRAINLLFDEQAKDYESIDFNGLYGLLEGVVAREREREREQNQRGRADIQQTEKEKEVMKETIKDLETKQTQFNQELAQNIEA